MQQHAIPTRHFRLTKIITFILLAFITLLSCTSMPSVDIPTEQPSAPAMASPPRVALVLGSGGARGYAHIGVIEALEDANIPIDMIVGASSGSIIGALYADSTDIDQVRAVMLNTGFRDFVDLNALFKRRGFISGSRVQQFMLDNMSAQTFDELKIRFVTVATDLQTGEAVTLDGGPIAPAINASVALPGLLRPVELYGHYLIDGGVVEPNPISIAKAYHPDIIIAVDIAEPLRNDLPKTAYGVYSRAHDLMWYQLNELTLQDADFVIRPTQNSTATTFSLSAQADLYQAGLNATEAAIPELLALLETNQIALSSNPELSLNLEPSVD